MSKLVKICTLFVSFCFFTASHAAGLTEKTVNDYLARVDGAISTLSVAQVGDALSDNVAITINVTAGGRQQVMKPSKQEYLQMLQQGWVAASNYKYHRSNTKIKITGDRAYVTSDVTESMVVQGQSISGKSKEETTIELVGGKPKATKIVAHTAM